MSTTLININGETREASSLNIPADARKFRDAWSFDGDNVVIDWSKAVTNFRATAKLRKADFCLACYSAGYITEADALEAAKGNWPASFDAAIASLTAAQQLAAKVKWAATEFVFRSSPELDLLAAAIGITAEDVDALFGYDGEYPV